MTSLKTAISLAPTGGGAMVNGRETTGGARNLSKLQKLNLSEIKPAIFFLIPGHPCDGDRRHTVLVKDSSGFFVLMRRKMGRFADFFNFYSLILNDLFKNRRASLDSDY